MSAEKPPVAAEIQEAPRTEGRERLSQGVWDSRRRRTARHGYCYIRCRINTDHIGWGLDHKFLTSCDRWHSSDGPLYSNQTRPYLAGVWIPRVVRACSTRPQVAPVIQQHFDDCTVDQITNPFRRSREQLRKDSGLVMVVHYRCANLY